MKAVLATSLGVLMSLSLLLPLQQRPVPDSHYHSENTLLELIYEVQRLELIQRINRGEFDSEEAGKRIDD